MTQELAGRIAAYLEGARPQILADLKALAAIPSIEGEPAPGAPFGPACARALKTAAELFRREGFETVVYENDGYALAQAGDPTAEKVIGLFGHSDVVPVDEEDWIFTAPFEPIEKDGLLIGRGVNDNKSGIIAALYLSKMIRDLKLPFPARLQTFIGSNEETGMRDIDAFCRDHKAPDLSLVPDNAFPLMIGEKGTCAMWAVSPAAFKQIKSLEGGKAFNIALARVTTVFTDNSLEAELRARVEGDNRYRLETTADGLTLTAIGVPKHSASPQDSVNAAWLTAKLLLDCPSLCAGDRATISVVSDLLSGYYGEVFGVVQADPNFGKLTCVNGIAKTVDGKIRLLFDIRYGTATDPATMLEKVKARVAAMGWTLEGVKNNPGYCLSADHPMIPVLLKAFRDHTGDPNANFRYSLGGTYARHLPNAFSIGTMVAPKQPLPIALPAGHGGAHQSDEVLRVNDYLEAIAITAHMLLDSAEAL